MPKKTDKGDVHWYVPNRKKPVAYSTACTNIAVCNLAEDGKTFKQIREMFTNEQIIFDAEVVAVLDSLIQYGLGDKVARDCLDMYWLNK